MVEKTHSGECHYHVIFVAAIDNCIVTDGAAGFCDIFYTAAFCSFNVVTEGEECIGTESNAFAGCKECFCFFVGKRFGLLGEVFLPVAVCTNVLFVFVDVTVDYVIAVGASEFRFERKVKNFFVLTEEPGICFGTCKAGAVDSGLLTCANTDCLSVNCIANGVGLGIFKGDKSNDEVALCSFEKLFVFCYYIFEKVLTNLELIATLLECDTEYFLAIPFRETVFLKDFAAIAQLL